MPYLCQNIITCFQNLSGPIANAGAALVMLIMFSITGMNSALATGAGSDANFVVSGMTAIDLRNGREWMRCSLGQQFDNNRCTGEPLRLDHDQIAEAISIANRELGGIWRLPTRKELELLVCDDCDKVKINSRVFPDTIAEPYWTGQKNWISPKNIWSVNFMTGHSYGRFFPYQKLAVRLLKDR